MRAINNEIKQTMLNEKKNNSINGHNPNKSLIFFKRRVEVVNSDINQNC